MGYDLDHVDVRARQVLTQEHRQRAAANPTIDARRGRAQRERRRQPTRVGEDRLRGHHDDRALINAVALKRKRRTPSASSMTNTV